MPPEAESGLLGLSADYSDDELDAVAELFDRKQLGLRRSRGDASEAVRRAVADAALRALVARRAIVLEGSAAHPRVRFLDPHALLLDPFVGADTTIAIRRERPGRAEQRVLHLRGDNGVEQRPVGATSIKRLTAFPRAQARELAIAELPFGEDAPAAGAQVELTLRMFDAAERAIAGGDPVPSCVPADAVELLHARRGSAIVTVVRRRDEGTVERERIAWLDAGVLGTWRVEAGDGEPPAVMRLSRTSRQLVLADLDHYL